MTPNNTSHDESTVTPQADEPQIEATSPQPRRSGRAKRAPEWMQDYVVQTETHRHTQAPEEAVNIATVLAAPKFTAFLAKTEATQDPVSFKAALMEEKWVRAMNLELAALEVNHTWDITELPPRKKAIGCKWLYKTKFNADGSVERKKARLEVLGCRQREGIDFDQTFAPLAKMTTVRALLSVAAM